MKRKNGKTSRERTDIFYNSSSKKLNWNSKNVVIALVMILVLGVLLYKFGYFFGETAYKKGL